MTMFVYRIALLLLCSRVQGFVREQAFSFSWRPTTCILTPHGLDCSDGFDGTLDICGSRCYDRNAIEIEFKKHLRGIRQLQLGTSVEVFTAQLLREKLRAATIPQLEIFCYNTADGVSLFREARICFTISQHNQICYQQCLDESECGEKVVLPVNVSAIVRCVNGASGCHINETLVESLRGETKRRSIFSGVGVLAEKMDDIEKMVSDERDVVASVDRLERRIESAEDNVTRLGRRLEDRIRRIERKSTEREEYERRLATTNNTHRLKAIDRRLEVVERQLDAVNATLDRLRADVDRRSENVERRVNATIDRLRADVERRSENVERRIAMERAVVERRVNATIDGLRAVVERRTVVISNTFTRRLATLEQNITLLANQTAAKIRECEAFLLFVNETLVGLQQTSVLAKKIISNADRVGPAFWIAMAAVFCGLSLIACMCYCIKNEREEIC